MNNWTTPWSYCALLNFAFSSIQREVVFSQILSSVPRSPLPSVHAKKRVLFHSHAFLVARGQDRPLDPAAVKNDDFLSPVEGLHSTSFTLYPKSRILAFMGAPVCVYEVHTFLSGGARKFWPGE